MVSVPADLSLLQVLPVAVLVTQEGVIRYANPACLVLFEADEPSQFIGHPSSGFVHPFDQQRSNQRIQTEAHTGKVGAPNKSAKIRIQTCQGNLRMAVFTSMAIEWEDQPSVISCGIDMTHQSEVEAQLRESEQNYRRLFENMQDVYYRTNALGVVQDVGPAVRRVLGFEPEEIIGRTAESYYPQSSDRDAFKAAIAAHGRVADFPGQMVRKDGQVIDISISSHAFFDADGQFAGIEGIYRDVTQRKNLERQLQHMASTDALTGTASRRAFLDRAEAAFHHAHAEGLPLTLLMLDLDHFKHINDSLGHLEGDRVLTHFAQVVHGLLRTDDTVGRLGGEEFAVLLPRTGESDGAAIADRILQHVRRMPLNGSDGLAGHITTSIGLAHLRTGDDNLTTLLGRADQALYQAKRLGRDRWVRGD